MVSRDRVSIGVCRGEQVNEGDTGGSAWEDN